MQLVKQQEDSTEEILHSVNSNKKKHNMTEPPLKKVKYDDISEENALKKKTKNELYKPPTVEELNELKETQNLYNNNLFRLQIEELLKEVKIKNKHRKSFTDWIQNFQTLVDDLKEFSLPSQLLQSKFKKKNLTEEQMLINHLVTNSLPQLKCDHDFILKLEKPENVKLFGLDSINALPGPKLQVNINLSMPRVCFQVKDYLNGRYLVKRHWFLLYISYFLKEKADVVYDNGNELLPILEVDLGKIIVHIYATPTENYFKLSRFLPDVNNIKINIFNLPIDNEEVMKELPTTFYNNSLAHDVTLTTNNKFINDTLFKLTNVQEAIKLIHIWISQRELNQGFGCFTQDLILYFVTYLAIKKRINMHMSSYQVVRNFWSFIKDTDLTVNPISLCEDVKDFSILQKFFDVIFLDITGYYNVSGCLSLGMYFKVKSECDKALKLLDEGGSNSFHSLFISKLPTAIQYDLIVRLKSDNEFNVFSKMSSDEEKTKFMGHTHFFVTKHISRILHRGLNKRAALIVPILKSPSNNIGLKLEEICFGINLDQSNAFNFMEMGPALNDPKEKEFREFWGHLSSDRRFKDGSACVAVYFETNTIKDKRGIIKQILDWVITNKLNLKYTLHYNTFENLLVNQKVTASYPIGTNEEACMKIVSASDELSKKIRTLGMALAITSIQGISDCYSFTEVFPPIATSFKLRGKVTSIENNVILPPEKRVGIFPRYVPPIECVFQLEHSSKWPKDLEGVRKMKTAFYLEMAKLLTKNHNILSSVKLDFLDIFYEGFVFRYHLYLPREIGLLKKELINNGVTVYKESLESKAMEQKLDILPKVTGALKGIQSQYPSYGPSTALIKRWLRSHLIDHFHFPDVVINLLNASLYISETAFMYSSTPQIAFFRFLKHFTELQYDIQPVVINFNEEIAKETIANIESQMLQNRQGWPSLCILMSYDNYESSFTINSPTKEVLRRVKQLAGETLSCSIDIIKEEKFIDIRELFVPNLEGYDLVIHIKPLLNPLRHENIMSGQFEGKIHLGPYKRSDSTKIPITGFNPVQCYLQDLRKHYGEYAHFFHDSYGGNIIGVLWIPKMLEPREFKVSLVNGGKVENGKIILNVDGIIEDFFILGKDVVKTIDKK